jgi:hypothetical protein
MLWYLLKYTAASTAIMLKGTPTTAVAAEAIASTAMSTLLLQLS